jgi:ABC-type transporter Mla subunit MlaD
MGAQDHAPGWPKVVLVVGALLTSVVGCGFEPDSYRFSADFSEPVQVEDGAEVRIGAVAVGEVTDVSTVDGKTRVEMEIEPDYAPIEKDTKAILRSRTLLGEVYVELAPAEAQNLRGPSAGPG